MIDALLKLLWLRCSHGRITRPITPLPQAGAARSRTYVVCLDCGAELPYDWKNMRLDRQYQRPRNTEMLPHFERQACDRR